MSNQEHVKIARALIMRSLSVGGFHQLEAQKAATGKLSNLVRDCNLGGGLVSLNMDGLVSLNREGLRKNMYTSINPCKSS